jgi:NarL family two-component system response regulator LiaR
LSEIIKVMIIDDHDMVRLGLRTYLMLETSIQVIGEAENGLSAVQKLEKGLELGIPDVILMDLMMPIMDGIDATAAIISKFPNVKIIILTSFLEEDRVVKAIEAGAVSYVLKTVSADQLIVMIQGAYANNPVMTSEISMALTRGLRQRSLKDEDEGLTMREKDVMFLVAEGRSNKEIGEELHISIKTVKTHVSNLLMKCGLEDRTQLAIYAHRKGWVGK